MDFMAPHYPMDDPNQASYWPDNDETEAPINDHFLDQFVSFDGSDVHVAGGDFLQNPPTPSMFLDPADDNAFDLSSHTPTMGLGLQPGPVMGITSPIEIPPRATPILRRRNHLPSVLTTEGPTDLRIITDHTTANPDLLHLEGISLRSPQHQFPAPESPPSTRGASLSPRKNGFIDTVYATIRKATHRTKLSSKSNQPRTSIVNLDMFRNQVKPEDLNQTMDMSQLPEHQLLPASTGPTDSNGLPLSPPLTGKIPTSGMRPQEDVFVTGHLDDPFNDACPPQPSMLSLPTSHGDGRGNTPIATPALNSDGFYRYATNSVETEVPLRRPKAQRSTSTAEWPSEGLLTEQNQAWSDESQSSAYMNHNGVSNAGWWDANDRPGHDLVGNGFLNTYAPGVRRASTSVLSSIDTSSSQSIGFDLNSIADTSNSSQHDDMAYQYDSLEASGLMIQMPQSQPPFQTDGLIGSGPPCDRVGSGFPPPAMAIGNLPPTPSLPYSSQHHIPTHQGFTEHRRPKPRAPSSGARHYGSLTSPRKPSLQRSGSKPILHEESPSPTPAHPGSMRQRSASISSIRKKKSWCRQQQREQAQVNSRTTPNTPAGLSSSASFGSLMGTAAAMVQPPATAPVGTASGMSSRSSSVGGGISLGGIDFVNFTPGDKNVLMTGVAPSGSSKTKARREKEAADKRRRLNEAAVQAVQAAGGDVEKLRLLEQGFSVIET